MKALIVIEIDEKHLLWTSNDLFERLQGYECELKPMPEKKEGQKEFGWNCCEYTKFTEFEDGWNACIKEILGETDD